MDPLSVPIAFWREIPLLNAAVLFPSPSRAIGSERDETRNLTVVPRFDHSVWSFSCSVGIYPLSDEKNRRPNPCLVSKGPSMKRRNGIEDCYSLVLFGKIQGLKVVDD